MPYRFDKRYCLSTTRSNSRQRPQTQGWKEVEEFSFLLYQRSEQDQDECSQDDTAGFFEPTDWGSPSGCSDADSAQSNRVNTDSSAQTVNIHDEDDCMASENPELSGKGHSPTPTIPSVTSRQNQQPVATSAEDAASLFPASRKKKRKGRKQRKTK